MDYEQKYKDTIERAKKELEACGSMECYAAKQLFRLFPEIKESEDERIRKALIKGVESCKASGWTNFGNNVDIDVVLPWLEKQGDKDKLIKELGEYKVKYTQEVLEKYINSIDNKDEERLRKTTIAFLKDFAEQGYENAVECIDWLEKQCEQKPTSNTRYKVSAGGSLIVVDGKPFDYEKATITQKDFAPKQEPKFKVGDWVVYECGEDSATLQIKNIVYGTYEFTDDSTLNVVDEDSLRLWAIQDAKDGDVLHSPEHKLLWIYKNKEEYHAAINLSYANFVSFGADIVIPSDVHPATKEQRDMLFAKMEEAGYQWDAEKLELKKIEDEIEIPFGAKDSELQEATYYIPKGFHAEIDDDKVVIKKGEKSVAWSEEDEENFQHCTGAIWAADYYLYEDKQDMEAWLKRLKNRIGG